VEPQCPTIFIKILQLIDPDCYRKSAKEKLRLKREKARLKKKLLEIDVKIASE